MNDLSVTGHEFVSLTPSDNLLHAADIIIRHIGREMATDRFKTYEPEDIKVFKLVRVRAEFLRSLFDGPSRHPDFHPGDISKVLAELDVLQTRTGGISVTYATSLVKTVDDMILAYYRAILQPVPTGFWRKFVNQIRPA